jgi:hypothetical protein
MTDRPILYAAPMVRATLDNIKTQTRRVVKPSHCGYARDADKCDLLPQALDAYDMLAAVSPYGQPGDRLWVRENGWERPERTPKMMREGADTWAPYYFDADGLSEQDHADFKQWGFKRRPSIHMPRWASRIKLEIVSVRVERLQDISEADCIAEGIQRGRDGMWNGAPHAVKGTPRAFHTAIGAYDDLWTQINGPGSWTANPWVWVVEFKRVTP